MVAVSFFVTIILFLGVYPPMKLVSVESASLRNTGTVNGKSSLNKMQYVYGDGIFDGNGSEVVWRGVGVDYLFAEREGGATDDDYLSRWQAYLPQIQQMNLNTVRLAFAFPDSTVNLETGRTTHSILDYNKLEQSFNLLGQLWHKSHSRSA